MTALSDSPLLFSVQRSPEFRLPDISLSSLDALLQTVTQKLGRKRTVGAEGPSRRIQPGHLLMAVGEQRLGGRSVGQQISHCTEDVKPANMCVWCFILMLVFIILHHIVAILWMGTHIIRVTLLHVMKHRLGHLTRSSLHFFLFIKVEVFFKTIWTDAYVCFD